MSGNVTVIDIVAQVTDETASGSKSAQSNISRLEKSMKSLQQHITDMKGKSKLEIAASLKDMASAGLQKIVAKGKSLAGKAFTVTMKLKDLVTAPFKGIAKMITNPIVVMATVTGLSFGVADTINTFKSFEQGMANVKAIVNASDEDFASLTAEAKRLGETTMFSASQAAEAMENLAMAGWKTKEIIAGMPGLLNLAAAGSVDLATASDVVSSAIAQFKLEASESNRIADVLAATATNSRTNVQGLGESLKYAGTMAGALGYSLEDTALALGLMGNAGVDASSAGSSLRMMFARMSKQEGLTAEESSAVSDAMKKVGVSLTDNKGKMKTMYEVMKELRTGFGKLTESEKAATAANLAGAYSMTGLLAIVNASDDKFDELTKAINESERAASRMADMKMDTLQGSMYYLQSAAEGLKIAVGEKLEPYLRGFIDWLTGKMPAVKAVAMDAMDFLGGKIQSVQKRIEKMTQSNEWKGAATLWDKIKVAWDKIIAEPFDEWWNGSGRSWLAEKANGVGNFMGSFLKSGLLTLLGVDVDGALNEGMEIGRSFMDGFLDGFEPQKIVEAVGKAFKAIAADAASLLPGGKEATSTSGISAALMGYGALKIGSLGVNLFKGGKTVVSGVKGIAGAIKGAGAAGATAAAAGAGATGAAGAGIAGALAPVAIVAAVVGAAAIGMSKNSERLNKAAKEFVDNRLFNNGLPKLVDYTAALKANNAETYKLATRINKTTSELETIQERMRDASRSVDFYSTSLQENGTLSQQEAKKMYEPFNQLCNSLKDDFEVRYNSVFDAFKLAAGEVATSLGADVAAISATLDKFKEKYTSAIQASQDNANSLIERLGSKDLSDEERAALSSELQKELQKISDYANVEKSRSQYDYEQMYERVSKVDFGADPEKAMSNLAELSDYMSAYAAEIEEAAKNTDLQYENLRGKLQKALNYGDISQEEYDSFLEAVNTSQAMVDKMFDNKLQKLVSDKENLQASFLNQIHREIQAGVNENLNSPWAWASKEAFFGIFTDDPYGEFYKSVQKEYQGMIDEVNAFPDILGGITWEIPVEIKPTLSELEKNAPNTATDDNLSNNAQTVQLDPGNRLVGGTHHSGGGGGRARANGGILSSPEIALVAEDGAEAIIPLSGKRRDRGLALWKETGRMLGVREYAEGGIAGAFSAASGGNISRDGGIVNEITIEIGGFNVTVDGSAAPDDIVEVIRANIAGFTDEIADELAEKLKAVFSNMPLKISR